MNTQQVVIHYDNDSVETVEILDEDAELEDNKSPATRHSDPDQFMEIEIDGTSNKQKSDDAFASLLRNNRLISKLVKKCLNMKNSYGMSRVIHKALLPMYKDTDSSFKQSDHLRRIVKTTLKQLELDPSHKFSHIKSLCDLLQSKIPRKKVPFITLSTDVRNNSNGPSVTVNNNSSIDLIENNVTKINKNKTDIIDLAEPDKNSVIILDNNEEDNDVMILEDTGYQTPKSDNSNKENNRLSNEFNSDNGTVMDAIQFDNEIPNTSEDNNLLTPQKNKDFSDEQITIRKVQKIEAEIASYKSILAELEKQEVTDSIQSAYLQCDKVKLKIVQLYEELCRLTGEQAVKRRAVRLQVTEGHPPGPVNRLEEFLNANIDSTGTTPFPDFHDVVNCVQKANKDDGLGWTKVQIMKEARSLFSQCGHAIRKRRQKREWRDLMSLVKEEQPDGDPANEDPSLLARLEENKRLAAEKERDILERFSQMECLPTMERPASSPLTPRMGNMETEDTSEDTSDSESDDSSEGNSESVFNHCESSKNNMDIDDSMASNNVDEASNVDSELPIQIKDEPKDIQSLLDGLGSDYTVTVCDIEDPFLVIEISSDSSYSDDDS